MYRIALLFELYEQIVQVIHTAYGLMLTKHSVFSVAARKLPRYLDEFLSYYTFQDYFFELAVLSYTNIAIHFLICIIRIFRYV